MQIILFQIRESNLFFVVGALQPDYMESFNINKI